MPSYFPGLKKGENSGSSFQGDVCILQEIHATVKKKLIETKKGTELHPAKIQPRTK